MNMYIEKDWWCLILLKHIVLRYQKHSLWVDRQATKNINRQNRQKCNASFEKKSTPFKSSYAFIVNRWGSVLPERMPPINIMEKNAPDIPCKYYSPKIGEFYRVKDD